MTTLSQGSQSIAFGAWLVAVIVIPMALVLRSYDVALLALILVVAWQFVAAAFAAVCRTSVREARTSYRLRLTSWGMVCVAVTGMFCFIAFHWGINLLYLTTAFLVAILVCGVVFPWVVLSKLHATWRAPDHVFAGESFAVDVTLANGKRVVGAFGVWVGSAGAGAGPLEEPRCVYALPPGAEHRLRVPQAVQSRGLQPLPPIVLSTSFPFGVFDATKRLRRTEEVLVLPRLGHLREDVLRRRTGGEGSWLMEMRRKHHEGEFRSLREYRPGDNPHLIHWPTSARLRKLYVREFERREMHSMLLVLDAYLPASDAAHAVEALERFDLAVSVAATLASVLADRGVFFAFASCCPQLVALPYDTGRGHLHTVLEALALAEMTSERDLRSLSGALNLQEVSMGGVCVVTQGNSGGPGRTAMGGLGHSPLWIDVSEPDFDEIFSF